MKRRQAARATPAGAKTVELRVPGHGRTARVTGNESDRSVVAAIDYEEGYYERHVMGLVGEILKPDSLSLDIGANIGVISIAMAWASPAGQVVAFEASTTNYRYLCHNLIDNEIENVMPVHVALYDERMLLELSYVEEVAACSFLSPKGVREGRTELVAAQPLDDWLSASPLDASRPIRLIKMDVEGAESRVLRGARQTILQHRPHLLIEFNPSPIERFFGEDPRDLLELLMELYPSVDTIDFQDGSLRRVTSYESLQEQVRTGRGWLDLYCRF